MKILYFNNNGNKEYIGDTILHGLINLGHEVVDIPRKLYLEKSYKGKDNFYTKGFTWMYVLDDRSNIDRTNIEQKIRDKYFDLVIYAGYASVTEENYCSLVSNCYDHNRIFILDGDDDQAVRASLFANTKIKYFKRELNSSFICNVYPISISIPKEKFQPKNYNKTDLISKNIPKFNFIDNYGVTFDTEEEYYAHYNNAYFGYTCAKAGIDCVRHYEIVACYCVPIWMYQLNSIPKTTMITWPMNLSIEALSFFYQQGDFDYYFDICDRFYDHGQKYFTTEYMANYLLNFWK